MDSIPFGVSRLDSIIGGGAPPGTVVLLVGDPGAGAREFAYTSAATNALAHADEELFDLHYGSLHDDAAPLSDLARRVGERHRRESGDDDANALFDEMNVGGVDEETLWASLADADAAKATHVGAGAAESVEEVRGGVPGYADHLVPKAEFCEQCPHLSDPPELACDREGTEIVEVADSNTFRVRDCPMVEDE